MLDLNLMRHRLLTAIGSMWLTAVIVVFSIPIGPILGSISGESAPVVVTHWANGHMMRPMLLPEMAARFNKADFRTQSGRKIEVRPVNYGSAEQADDLVSRVTVGVPLNQKLADPTIVTPSADHWLVLANNKAGRDVVDISRTESIARTWIGIVTYREMAECLGWPNKEIGYADIIALRSDPRGWASYPCAKAEWGQRPIFAYTDPSTSSTGRSVLFSLYSIAAGKSSEQLTVGDVSNPSVIDYVKRFQKLVDHYVIGTIPLNTKVYRGPRYGQFFLMPEDNLIHLYQGTEFAMIDGKQVQAPPISKPMVMIYPKEGSTLHNHSASFVQAPWVTDEQKEAARKWVDFLHEDEQQRAFMAGGFRPSTNLPLADPISGRFGLDPTKPTITVNPDRIDRSAGAAIVGSWNEVKKPGVVTLVVDVSGSMQGTKLAEAKTGLIRAIDGMSGHNQVGLVTFGDKVVGQVPVAPLTANRFIIADAVEKMRAQGGTALYDALKAGIEMTDTAAADEDAIRGVVVLTDGRANNGQTVLHDLVKMTSRNEVPIAQYRGFETESWAVEDGGRNVDKKEVIGTELAIKTRYPINIFYIGIGSDADMEVGRVLSEATGAAFQGVTEKDLAKVIEEFGKYF